MIPNASPATRRKASYAGLALVLVFLPLLPSKAEGITSAYIAFIVGLVLAAFVSAIGESRWHLTTKDFPVPAFTVAGVVLVIANIGVPVLETGAMGVMSGALVGLAGMVLIQEGFRASPDEVNPESGPGGRG